MSKNNQTHPFEYVDRYGDASALRPNPATICTGQCEGTGFYPVQENDTTLNAQELAALDASRLSEREAIQRGEKIDRRVGDNWYFIRCPTCGGTGKRA